MLESLCVLVYNLYNPSTDDLNFITEFNSGNIKYFSAVVNNNILTTSRGVLYASSLSDSNNLSIPIDTLSPSGNFKMKEYGGLAILFGTDAIFRTDGTPGGTFKIADVGVEIDPFIIEDKLDAYEHNGILYFNGINQQGGNLWRSDGTTAGTYLIKDFSPSEDINHNFINFITYRDSLYFSVSPQGLGVTDGTEIGTFAKDEFAPFHFVHDSILYLFKSNSIGSYEPTTNEFTSLFTIRDPVEYYPMGHRFLITQSRFGQENFYVSNGTIEGSQTVIGDENFSNNQIISFQGKVYYTKSDEITGNELWVTDGTLEGTTLIEDQVPGTGGLSPSGFLNHNGRLIFKNAASASIYGQELFFLDNFFFPNVDGITYNDRNENGRRDLFERRLPSLRIELLDDEKSTYTNQSGYFGFEINDITNKRLKAYDNICWEPIIVEKPIALGAVSNNFGYRLKTGLNALAAEVDVNYSPVRCNSEGRIWLNLINSSCDSTYAGKMEVKLDSLITLISASTDFTIENDTYIFHFDSIQSGEEYSLKLNVRHANELNTGALLTSSVETLALVDNNYFSLGISTTSEILRCAYDPNDKLVSPS